MTTTELFTSLNTEQTVAVNALLIEQRDALTSAHVSALAAVTTNDQAQIAEIARLTALVPPETPPEPPADQAWIAFLAGSITDNITGIALKANRSAKNDFVAMFTLLSAAISIGAIDASAPQEIWDASNQPHALPASDILALLIRYGFAWQTAFNALAP